VDDTVCSHENIDALSLSDAVSTSLTKWVSGIGDIMAGSVKLNAESPFGPSLREALEIEVPGGSRIYARDAEVLNANAKGLSARVRDSNRGGEFVANLLDGHEAIERVWYPSLTDREAYDQIRTPAGGYGGLMSFTLKNPERAPMVYQAMRFSKGPSLGTEYSLLCPYTLLAHYTELDWAGECGVPAELLRLSVGREPVEELQTRLEEALQLA
jgi:cystathionine gamma-synthase